MPPSPGFWDTLNQSAQAIVPMAIKKWELDTAANRWGQQLSELKRQHDMTMGRAFLDSGDIANAATMFRSAGLDVDPNVLTQSPAMQLKKAQTEEALRALTAKKDITEEIRALVAPKTVETPVALGIGGEIPEGVEVPTTKTTLPGKEIGLKDYINIVMKHDPQSASLLKAIGTQSAAERAEQMGELKVKLAEIVGQTKMDAAKAIADARITGALIAAGAKDRAADEKKLPPSYDKEIDRQIGQLYVADQNIGPALGKRLEKARMLDPRVSIFDVMDQNQQVSALRIKEYATDALQSRQAKTIQQAIKIGLDKYHQESGSFGKKVSSSGGAGGYTFINGRLVENQ
jgi:hypothetical protein